MPAALNSYMVLVITENVVSELVGKILYQFILTRYFGLPSKNVLVASYRNNYNCKALSLSANSVKVLFSK